MASDAGQSAEKACCAPHPLPYVVGHFQNEAGNPAAPVNEAASAPPEIGKVADKKTSKTKSDNKKLKKKSGKKKSKKKDSKKKS